MDDLLMEFVTETTEALGLLDQELVRFEQHPNDGSILQNIFRVMHTIKGTCGFLGLPRLEKVAHAGEDVLGKFRDGEIQVNPAAVTLILRCIDKIRGIVEHIEKRGTEPAGDDSELIAALRRTAEGGDTAPALPIEAAPQPKTASAGPAISEGGFPVAAELLDECEALAPVTVEAPVAAEVPVAPAASDEPAKDKSAAQTIRVTVDVLEDLMTLVSEMVLTRNQLLQLARSHEDSVFKDPIQRLSRVTSELQEGVMKTRMQPIGNAWNKLTRIVRDLGADLGKRINLQMHGEETELDRQVLELIRDPLTHMVRNSADHGLEGPEERRAAGKPETGTIRLSAYHEGGHIIIEIVDDGRGLNIERIKAKALERGLATAAELAGMADAQIQQFIMKAGFSTAEKVTNVSGRGVGMDVVRSNIEKIGGTVQFTSVYGQGSTFTIKIPLTLAIVSGLIVHSGGERFAIPQLAVQEVVRVAPGSEHKIERLKDMAVLRLRNRLWPAVSLNALLGLGTGADENKDKGYVVVCRSGNQSFGIIVDRIADNEEIVVKPLSLLTKGQAFYSGNTILGDGTVILILDPNGLASTIGETARQTLSETAVTAAATREVESILLFKAGEGALRAILLSQVRRIESFEAASIEIIQGEPVVQYRGRLMPLTSYKGTGQAGATQAGAGRRPVLVLGTDENAVGLVIDGIIDIVEDELKITTASHTPGVKGSAIVAGKAVDVVDDHHFLNAAKDKEVQGANSIPATNIHDLHPLGVAA